MKYGYKIVFTCLILGSLSTLHAQSNSSKFSKSNRSQTSIEIDRNKITQELNYAKRIYKDSLTKALTIVERSLIQSIENNFYPEQAVAYEILGEFNQYSGNYKVAISNYQKSIDILGPSSKSNKKISLYTAMGNCAKALNQVAESIAYYSKALGLATTNQLTNDQKTLSIKLGDAYLKNGELVRAESYYTEGLKIAEKQNDKTNITSTYIGLGKVEERKGNTKRAENYFNKASKIAVDIQSDALANSSMNSLSNLYEIQNSPEQQIQVQEQAYSYNMNRGNTKYALQNQSNIANSYLEQGADDEAVDALEDVAEIFKREGKFCPEKGICENLV
jgi:tetratricopeptide (TPR) repeat protein